MTFLAMITALALFQLGGAHETVQRDGWFTALHSSIRGLGLSPKIVFWVAIVLAAFFVDLLLDALEPLLFGLLWIAGSVVVLLYAFGRGNLEDFADRYHSYCLSGDFEGAYLYLRSEFGLPAEDEQMVSREAVHAAISRELLYTGYQRWFAVIFYFLLLGPAGALSYRLIHLSGADAERAYSERVLHWVDWLPARLLAAGFAVTGDFLASRDPFVDCVSDTESRARDVLLKVGKAALGSRHPDTSASEEDFPTIAAKEASELRDLASRSAGAWLVVISLAVLLL